MDPRKDYYAVLGLMMLADAVVIKAAYKALAQRYHPDLNPASDAGAKMQEINEAYSVLSDPESRRAYDNSRFRSEEAEFSSDSEDESSADVPDNADTDWRIAVDYFPSVSDAFHDLSRLSTRLGMVFRYLLLETKDYSRATQIAAQLEKTYLSRYFGNELTVQTFAKSLILSKNRKAALELNKIVHVLGDSVDPRVIIEKIKSKFGLIEPVASDVDRSEVQRLLRVLRNRPTVMGVSKLIDFLGGSLVTERSGSGILSFFGGARLIVKLNGLVWSFPHDGELLDWAQKELPKYFR